jgi:methylated-DNA-[protein]-cysteine S-methyltransferase
MKPGSGFSRSDSKTDPGFAARVLSVVRRIPVGRVTTYGDVARLAGAPRAARAVGTVMRKCRDPKVPCHRVIAAGGGLGGYGPPSRGALRGASAFLHVKRDLLRAEGLDVGHTRVRRFADVRWPAPGRVEGPAGNPSSPRRRLTLQKT